MTNETMLISIDLGIYLKPYNLHVSVLENVPECSAPLPEGPRLMSTMKTFELSILRSFQLIF